MRRVYIYSLLLFAICFAGCEHKLDSYPPHLYRYYLAFIDKSGNDLLADVPFEINSERDSVLLRGTYTFEFIKSTEDDYFDTKSLILGKVSGYQSLRIDVCMEDWYGHKKPEVLTHKLACKHIFGDEKVHTIVSYWKFDTDYREAELIRLTIDDVESPILEGFDKFYPQALVSLDKQRVSYVFYMDDIMVGIQLMMLVLQKIEIINMIEKICMFHLRNNIL